MALITDQEAELLSIDLQHLAPPQQDYNSLASNLLSTKGKLESPLAIIIAEYFQMFANGYAFWQQSYDYARIHEYFWVAQITAQKSIERFRNNLENKHQLLKDFFYYFSVAVIEDTNGENSLVCSMPKWLQISSKNSAEALKKAQNILKQLDLDERVSKPIHQYTEMNILHSSGVQRCAEIYLMAWQKSPDLNELARLESEARQFLNDLRPYSREVYSELRAHIIFSLRNAHAYIARNASALRVKQTDFILRAICYAGPDLIDAFYKRFNDEHVAGSFEDYVNKETGLKFTNVHGGYLNETFETDAGIKNMTPVFMDFASGEDGVAFSLLDGEKEIDYELEGFRVTVTPVGAISVDFQMSIGDSDDEGVSLSHLRVFEAMMGPHMGVFDIVWNQPPPEEVILPNGERLHFLSPETVNFVHIFRQCEDWIEEAEQHVPDGDDYDYLTKKIQGDALTHWQEAFSRMQTLLTDISRDSPYKEDEDGAMSYVADLLPMQNAYQEMRRLFLEWEWVQTDSDDDDDDQIKLKKEARKLFPRGRVFLQAIDIAEEIIGRIKRFLIHLAKEVEAETPTEKRYHEDDIRGSFWFDRNYGWQSVNTVNQMVMIEGDTVLDPISPDDFSKILSHPDFKGFKVTSREARAGLDDWYEATPFASQVNLGPVRSHGADFMVVEQNRAVLYFPDDPQFIIEGYVDTVLWATNLINVVLAHQVFCQDLIHEIDEKLNALENDETIFDELPHLRGKIQIMTRRIDKVIEFVRGSTMTKYVDHSELMREIIKTNRTEYMVEILSHHLAILNRLYTYMGDLLTKDAIYS